ncbi:hypothetical protein ANCDUO_10638 [Ancylostoma duodenale]|uniref:Protein kinase domain-containing protein n=1 Tax=Ancylostoma duodenale TaxID=51022 RepID=A0A0C2CQT0_9BILA|nr:hypothetical protein ANCDUO_10638 [Ancylostoma duodenale]
METIGEGTFSVVKRALWYHPSGVKLDVAVKILRDISPSLIEDLQVEASHLLKLQHSNLIRMYGIVQQPAMMVFELCEGGELLNRLRDTSKPPPLVTTLLDYCLQIVKALTFLESKHFVHRDVAARNILLSKDEKASSIVHYYDVVGSCYGIRLKSHSLDEKLPCEGDCGLTGFHQAM